MDNKLYLPINFWSQIISVMDSKVEILCNRSGYGEVILKMKVHRGKVSDIYLSDEIKIRGILEQPSEEENQKPT